ncbi:hypothetical protein BJ170DRAFT_595257 [Xylariales sp. AK1849]|nr:hypothetical protein BJ170DRAFT_595257 [Xylariales sp. AK1849]
MSSRLSPSPGLWLHSNQTCKFLHYDTKRELYKAVFISTGRGQGFVAAMAEKRDLWDRVREVEVDMRRTRAPKRGQRRLAWDSACALTYQAAEFKSLEVLSLRSEYANYGVRSWQESQEKLELCLQRASLRAPIGERLWCNLRSLTLDFTSIHDNGWLSRRWPAVFEIMTLNELIVRGCNTIPHGHHYLTKNAYHGQIGLRKLGLMNSFIDPDSLGLYLAMPKALTHLFLDHRDDLTCGCDDNRI